MYKRRKKPPVVSPVSPVVVATSTPVEVEATSVKGVSSVAHPIAKPSSQPRDHRVLCARDTRDTFLVPEPPERSNGSTILPSSGSDESKEPSKQSKGSTVLPSRENDVLKVAPKGSKRSTITLSASESDILNEPNKSKGSTIIPSSGSDKPEEPKRSKGSTITLPASGSNVAEKVMMNLSQRKKNNYFDEVLALCGFDLETHTLCQDETIFCRDVKLKLEEHFCFPTNIAEFQKYLEEFCNNTVNLKKCLQPTRSHPNSEAKRNQQESLIHLLLEVECLQARLIEYLCERLVEICSDLGITKGYPWARMLLKQFRFLSFVINPETYLQLLFDVLESVPANVKIDVLFYIPEIVSDKQHEAAAKRLGDLLLSSQEITPSILDALTNLQISSDLRWSVSETVIKALQTVPLEFYPNMVGFLIGDADPIHISVVVSHLRKLDFTPLSQPPSSQTSNTSSVMVSQSLVPSATVKSCEVLTVEVLRWSLMTKPDMAEAWLKAVKTVHSASEHRPLDLVMLLALYTFIPAACPAVEGLIRSKVRAGLFREKLVIKTFSTMLPVIKEYRESLMDLLYALLKSPEPAVLHHVSCWFMMCLKYLEAHQAQAVVQKLLLHVGCGSTISMRASLHVLSEITTKHLHILVPHQLMLLNLLDKVTDADLSMTETMLDVLCRVAFGPQSHNGCSVDDDLLMLARKQMNSWNERERKKGIIGSVLTAKHLACRAKETNSAHDIKQAVNLMDLVAVTVLANSDATGLFMDKLSSVVVQSSSLHENLIHWVSQYVCANFEKRYIRKKKDLQLRENLKLMFEIVEEDVEEEEEDCIALALLVNEEHHSKRCEYPEAVVMIASLRLVRCVKFLVCDGNLGDIVALLMYPVVMPITLAQEELYDGLDPTEQSYVLDCTFYCVNWFRELLSAFAMQKDEDIRKYVVLRLRDLVKLQQKLAKWLTMAFDYVPPPCLFDATARSPKMPKPEKTAKKKRSKRKKKPKKKRNSKKRKTSLDSLRDDKDEQDEEADAEEEEEDLGEAEEEEEEEVEEESKTTESCISTDPTMMEFQAMELAEYRGFLRELDVDVLALLLEPLALPAPARVKGSLMPLDLLFLLQDLTAKVEHVLSGGTKRASALQTASEKPLGFTNLDSFSAVNFARNTARMLPSLCEKLEGISDYCKALLNESDGIRDAPSMFPESSAEVKVCFTYIMRILAGFFGWSGFQSASNAKVLKDALKALASRVGDIEAHEDWLQKLVAGAFQYLQGHVEHTLLLPGACYMVKMFSAMTRLVDEDHPLNEKIVDTCKTFLGQRWYTLKGAEEKGAEYNQLIDTLLKTMFAHVETKLQLSSEIVTTVYKELESCIQAGTKEWSLQTFPAITKGNFPLLHRMLCSTLITGMDELLEVASTDTERLKVWEVGVDTLREIMLTTRLYSSRANLVAFVKCSLRLLKNFQRKGLLLLGKMFSCDSEAVASVLQSLQKSTRFLNSVCYHSKSSKEVALANQVPDLRLILEQVVTTVRVMLTENDCKDAFWVGVLKNRNLQGEEILSQLSQAETEEEEQNEKDLPPDDDSDVDVDLDSASVDKSDDDDDKDDKDDGSNSGSEIF